MDLARRIQVGRQNVADRADSGSSYIQRQVHMDVGVRLVGELRHLADARAGRRAEGLRDRRGVTRGQGPESGIATVVQESRMDTAHEMSGVHGYAHRITREQFSVGLGVIHHAVGGVPCGRVRTIAPLVSLVPRPDRHAAIVRTEDDSRVIIDGEPLGRLGVINRVDVGDGDRTGRRGFAHGGPAGIGREVGEFQGG